MELTQTPNSAPEKFVYLVDGHALVYRFHYAFADSPLTTNGHNVSAVYGVALACATLLKNHPVSHIGVIFDPPYRTWRREMYPAYKANREKADDLTPQLEMTYHLLKTWGIYTAAFRPLEADDVIGILAKKAEAKGHGVRIVTRDKDLAQLVTDKTKLIDLGQKIGQDEVTVLGREQVKTKYGVWPEQIVDWLAIMGDTSDNIPGIPGFGKKTAADMLEKYGTYDRLLASASELTEKKCQAVKASVEDLKRNRVLTALRLDYGVPVELEELQAPPTHSTDLFEELEKLEFYSIIKRLAD